jgi:hypothetical protein
VDLACKIQLNTLQTGYFHSVGSDVVLNTFDYANAQTSKQNYLVIAETTGKDLGGGVFDRIITSITPYRWDTSANGPTGAYVTTTFGSDLSYTNAKD